VSEDAPRGTLPVRQGAAALVLLGVVIAGLIGGWPWALWVLAAAALLTAIVLLWESLLALGGSEELTLEEAFSLAAPTAADEQKRAVLRALKDLEYELLMGKISQEDYSALSARYRAQARDLLRQLDQNLGDMRTQAEQLLRERLLEEGLDPDPDPKPAVKPDPADSDSSDPSREEAE
jgi:hypothetical protein